MRFFSARLAASFSLKRVSSRRSASRMPDRDILSVYAQPIPLPVVPMAWGPLRASLARSIWRW